MSIDELLKRLENPHQLVVMIHRREAAATIRALREALKVMIYETTHLSPEKSDGSHECRISKDALAKARAAYRGAALEASHGRVG